MRSFKVAQGEFHKKSGGITTPSKCCEINESIVDYGKSHEVA
jgi:hypothetical protein